MPKRADIAAVLEPLSDMAVVRVEAIERGDSKSLPDRLAADVLVQAASADISVELLRKAAA